MSPVVSSGAKQAAARRAREWRTGGRARTGEGAASSLFPPAGTHVHRRLQRLQGQGSCVSMYDARRWGVVGAGCAPGQQLAGMGSLHALLLPLLQQPADEEVPPPPEERKKSWRRRREATSAGGGADAMMDDDDCRNVISLQ